MSQNVKQAFLGSFFHTPIYGSFEYLEDALIEVDAAGVIARVVRKDDPAQAALINTYREAGVLTELGENRYGLPGFVDIHVHAPQWPQAALALDEPLYVWLEKCTFPLESKFADLDFADKVYRDLVNQLLARGSTTTVYLGSAHLESSILLAEICNAKGQRALVGKTVMDDPAANPPYYRDASVQSALADVQKHIDAVEAINRNSWAGVYPVVTPRFIPSCTDEVLKGMGDIAAKNDVYVQTHCNEGQWEHDVVLERFGKTDPYALRDFGLLREHAIMAHCPYLTPEEGEMFAELGVTIAHCPMANSYFSSAVAPIQRFRSQGIHVGLGTDISGGYSPSMYENIRQAVLVSRLLETGVNAMLPPDARGGLGEGTRLSVVEALWLATKGGGEALGLPVGSFQPGCDFDLQVVDVKRRDGDLTGFRVFDAPIDRLARILYLSSVDNVRKVYCNGKLLRDKDLEG
ncbi:MAG: guanine deaminase [Coriobacteriales bacterium]|nr:guanine deaminase [Coriobacteriales bacterium]